MYCRNCGKEIDDNAYICIHCGVKVQEEKSTKEINEAADNGSKVGWGFLCWFFPIVGLILYCIWKTERPKTALVCGNCALASIIVGVILSILSLVLAIVLFVCFGFESF